MKDLCKIMRVQIPLLGIALEMAQLEDADLDVDKLKRTEKSIKLV